MKTKNIKLISFAHEFQMGNMRVKQPLPARGLDQHSPFLLLHHGGPHEIEPNGDFARISPHPHRGFEPVTFLFQGGLFHKDSLGNEGYLESGDVQWMTAGSGVVHSEGPSPGFLQRGGTLELIQLWINLPKSKKMIKPRYQDIRKSQMPIIRSENGDVEIQVVSGTFEGKTGPAETNSPITSLMAHLKSGSEYTFSFNEKWNTNSYLLSGKLKINENSILEKLNFAVFENEGDTFKLTALEDSHLLLLSGEPIDEPVAAHGPFVMNTYEEIHEAIVDYQSGKMGDLDF